MLNNAKSRFNPFFSTRRASEVDREEVSMSVSARSSVLPVDEECFRVESAFRALL